MINFNFNLTFYACDLAKKFVVGKQIGSLEFLPSHCHQVSKRGPPAGTDKLRLQHI